MSPYNDLELISAKDHALRAMALAPGSTVVDVGCGTGAFVRWMAERSLSAVGVECGPVMLAEARRLSPDQVIEGVGQDLPIEDATANAVTFMSSLHHVPAELMATALAEARRVIAPGGCVHVDEPMAEGPSYQVGRLVDDEAEVRAQAQEVIRRCGDVGLQVVDDGAYLERRVYPDFAAYAAIMQGIDPGRAEVFSQVRDQVAEAFEHHAERTEAGYAFVQPKRFHTLVAL